MRAKHRLNICSRAIVWLAWKVDHCCHRVIEWLDPLSTEEMRLILDKLKEVHDGASLQRHLED